MCFYNETIQAHFPKKEDFRYLYMFAHCKIICTILNELYHNLAWRDYNEKGECKMQGRLLICEWFYSSTQLCWSTLQYGLLITTVIPSECNFNNLSVYFKPNVFVSLCWCAADWLNFKHKCNRNKTGPFILKSELDHSETLEY